VPLLLMVSFDKFDSRTRYLVGSNDPSGSKPEDEFVQSSGDYTDLMLKLFVFVRSNKDVHTENTQ
jgi:hypothetical protein